MNLQQAGDQSWESSDLSWNGTQRTDCRVLDELPHPLQDQPAQAGSGRHKLFRVNACSVRQASISRPVPEIESSSSLDNLSLHTSLLLLLPYPALVPGFCFHSPVAL